MQNKLVFTQAPNYLFENPLDDAVGCNNKHMGSALQLSGDLQDEYSEKFKAVGQADASSALWCPPSSVGVLGISTAPKLPLISASSCTAARVASSSSFFSTAAVRGIEELFYHLCVFYHLCDCSWAFSVDAGVQEASFWAQGLLPAGWLPWFLQPWDPGVLWDGG